MKISIIIPVYNEAKTILNLLTKIDRAMNAYEYEVVLIDDASVDGTFDRDFFTVNEDLISRMRVTLLANGVNKGKSFCLRRGIAEAKGDIIVIQDADEEYDPQDIPRLIQPLIDGACEVVYGSRFLESRYPSGMAFPNWVGNRALTALANMLFGMKITDEATCYKIFTARLLKSFPLQSDRFNFCPEVTGIVGRKKIPVREIPISYHGRTREEGKKVKAVDFLAAVRELLKQRFQRS